jgi:hypothetical protein
MKQPELKDYEGWVAALLEHRRALFERVLKEYPLVKKQFPSQVDIWRYQLTPPKHTHPSPS